MHRFFITGTDTDVGKTRIAAAMATALREAGREPSLVKPVQTGLATGEEGDAQRAASLSGVPWYEFERFAKPADPWSAALAERRLPPQASALAERLGELEGALVVEGAGGLMVPLNEREHFGHLVKRAGLDVVLVVGLRLGCINHASLTAALCEYQGLNLVGAVLVERHGAVSSGYAEDVRRALQGKLEIFGIVPFAVEEPPSVRAAARLFSALVT